MTEFLIKELEKKIGVDFKNIDLLWEAITHRSYLNEQPTWKVFHNERLEYLGDAVLELIVSEALFRRSENWSEGQMTLIRAALVNYQMLAKIAKKIDLEKYILMSKGENRDTNKAKEVILANAFEAITGAIYLDRGLETARKFISEFVLSYLEEIIKNKSYKDAKSELQEIIQEELKLTPTYKVLEEKGPPHAKIFKVGVYFDNKLIAQGIGSSKQEGELEAAKKALQKHKNRSVQRFGN